MVFSVEVKEKQLGNEAGSDFLFFIFERNKEINLGYIIEKEVK